MILDPYPDDVVVAVDQASRAELSEADRRLLAVLAQPGPPVVDAVEDELRRTAEQEGAATPWRAAPGRPCVPVFQEPPS